MSMGSVAGRLRRRSHWWWWPPSSWSVDPITILTTSKKEYWGSSLPEFDPWEPPAQRPPAHHEYRMQPPGYCLITPRHQQQQKNWQKICGDLLQFEWKKRRWLRWPGWTAMVACGDDWPGPATTAACHYHKPLPRNRSSSGRCPGISPFYGPKLFNFWFIELLMGT